MPKAKTALEARSRLYQADINLEAAARFERAATKYDPDSVSAERLQWAADELHAYAHKLINEAGFTPEED